MFENIFMLTYLMVIVIFIITFISIFIIATKVIKNTKKLKVKSKDVNEQAKNMGQEETKQPDLYCAYCGSLINVRTKHCKNCGALNKEV